MANREGRATLVGAIKVSPIAMLWLLPCQDMAVFISMSCHNRMMDKRSQCGITDYLSGVSVLEKIVGITGLQAE